MPMLALIPIMIFAAALGVVLCVSGLRVFRRGERVAEDAGFAQTLRAVPLRLVVGLDLLDLGLDVLAAPLVWWMLDRSGLKALRNVAAVEAVVPFTQAVPLMTLCWVGVRVGDSLGLMGDAAPAEPVGRKRVVNVAGR